MTTEDDQPATGPSETLSAHSDARITACLEQIRSELGLEEIPEQLASHLEELLASGARPDDAGERNAIRASLGELSERIRERDPDLALELDSLAAADSRALGAFDIEIDPDLEGGDFSAIPMIGSARMPVSEDLRAADAALVSAWQAREAFSAYMVSGETDPRAARDAYESALGNLAKALTTN